jgi:glycosyltransferase involved in cell wall biosynthesis
VALNYYAPYVSGVTEVARIVAEGLSARGWDVTVVASRHDEALPEQDTINGVRVVRTPVVARIGKGVISPTFVPTVARWARLADAVHVHLPMLEAGAIALATRHRPLVATYHCDVSLPPGAENTLQVRALDASHRVALRLAAAAVVTSADYAGASRLGDALSRNQVVIPPPCLLRDGGAPVFRDGDGLHVGFLGRIVEEKGLEYLVDGFRARNDDAARLLIAGDFSNVAGGSVVEKVRQHIGGDPRVRLLGFLPDEQISDFFASLDVFALPSVNSLEAFGIVQAEAMMLGVPVIAADRPGVRTVVATTGFGRLVPPRNAAAITTALDTVERDHWDTERSAARARELYGAASVIDRYESTLTRLTASKPFPGRRLASGQCKPHP